MFTMMKCEESVNVKTVADCTFQRLTQQYLSLYMLFSLRNFVACLHQEVESNSSPFNLGTWDLLLPQNTKEVTLKLKLKSQVNTCFPDAPTWGSVLQN